MLEILELRLATKKQNLKDEQEYFKIDLKHIEGECYEDNAINALLSMKKLKIEIAELELLLEMIKTNDETKLEDKIWDTRRKPTLIPFFKRQ